MGDGDQAGTWGQTTNTNLGTLLEQAVSGYVTQAVATGADTTITMPNGASGVARNMFLELTGTGGANTNLLVPANKKLYFIYNNTASGQVTVKVSGLTGVSVPNGAKILLVSNGTDIVVAQTYLASLSLGAALPVTSGGTGVTTSTGTGSVVLSTSPTLVTPALGTPASGNLSNCSNISLTSASGTLGIANGGTGATTAAAALTALGAYPSANPSGYTSNTGTVTSVAASTTPVNGLSLSGGTITGSGTIGLTGTLSGVSLTSAVSGTLPIANGGTGQTTAAAAITALAGTQVSGRYLRSNGTTTSLAAIVAADVPTLNQNTTGTAAGLSSTLAIASGGTGQVTAQAAINSLAGAQTNRYFLRGDGTNVAMSAIQAADVPTLNQNTTGTAANVTGTVAVANGGTGATTAQAAMNALAATTTSGSYLRGDGVNVTMSTIQAADVPTLNQNTTGTASNVTGTVAITNGGTGQTTANAALNAFLPSQATYTGRVLSTDGTNTSWVAVGSGSVTSVAGAGTVNGLTLTGTVTTSGSLTLGGTLSGVSLSTAVTGTLPITNGGTGQTSAAAALTALGAYPATNPNGYTNATGTVTQVVGTGGVNGLTLTGTVTSSGNLTLGGTLSGVSLSTAVTGTLPVANGGTGTTTSTGTGNVVLSTSPTLVTPVLGTPTSGNLANCTFPTLNQNTTGTAAGLSSTLAVASGGTGQTTAQLAINALAGAITSGQFLRGNGTNVVMSAIQASDVPTLNQNTSGTASNVTGTVAIANGGTGVTTAQAALNTLAASTASGFYLRGTGTNVVMSAIQAADVPTLNQNTTGTAAGLSSTLAIASGGTGQTTANAALNALLPSQATANGKVLSSDGTNTSWVTVGSGTVTSVAGAGSVNGLTLTGTVTSSGSLTLGGTLSNVSLSSAVTGVLPTANGGTGTSSSQTAMNTFAGATTSGQYLRGNGANVVMSAIQAADVPTLNQNTTGSSGSCTGNAATATTAGSITGQGALATLNGSQAETRNISGKTGTTKTLSTSAATGGSDGDIWYQY
jgi:hypothetical protein